MAEFMAVVGFTASVASLIDVGVRLVGRLNEYQSTMREPPGTFAPIKARLPLILNGLRASEEHARAGRIDLETQRDLKPAIDGCKDRVERLAKILERILPTKGDPGRARLVKALRSLAKDAEVQKLVKDIDSYLTTLTFHNTSLNSRSNVLEPALHWINMIPAARDPNFVDRPELFRSVDMNMKDHGRAALAGIGGAGKTQIAIEQCYRNLHAQPQTHIFWVHAGSTSKLLQSCTEIAEKLQIVGWDNSQSDTLRQLSRWLDEKRNGDWLLIVDNADDLDVLEGQLPSDNRPRNLSQLLAHRPHGKYLITTRDRRVGERLGTRGKTISVVAMSPSEGRLLMSAYIPPSSENTVQSIDELIAELDFLPLAISQATAYMIENYMTAEEYLSLLRDGDEERQALMNQSMSDDRRVGSESNSVIKTWKLSFDQLTRQNPLAADILSIMAMFDRQDVPVMLLSKTESRHAFTSAMATLQNFSLIVKGSNQESYQMHRLVQVCVQAWLQLRGTLQELQGEALSRLSTLFPSGFYENWNVCRLLMPHVRRVLSNNTLFDSSLLKRAQLLSNVAWYHYVRQQSKIALLDAEEACSLYARVRGSEDPDTLSCKITMAICMNEVDRPKDASQLLREIIPVLEKTYGPNHSETLRAMETLGRANVLTAEYVAADTMFRKVLDLRERQLGPMHHSVLVTKNELALNLARNCSGIATDDDLNEAQTMIREVLAGYEQLYGLDRPETLTCQVNLAGIVSETDAQEEAETLYRRALAGSQRLYGPENARTSKTSNNLAVCLKKQGKTEEALALYRTTLISNERTLGVDDLSTIIGRDNLIRLLTESERWEEVALHARVNLNCKAAIDACQRPDMSDAIPEAESSLAMAEEFMGESRESTEFVEEENPQAGAQV